MNSTALSLEAIREVVENVIEKASPNKMYDISSPQLTDSEIALLHLDYLRKIMPSFEIPPVEGPRICEENDLKRLIDERKAAAADADNLSGVKQAIVHESYLCWQMTPYLRAIFEQGTHNKCIVVNSEDYKWVHTYCGHEQNYMKPDFFVTLNGLMVREESSGMSYIKTLRNETENVEYNFGKMPWEIRDNITVLIEFKNKLAPQHFGKLILYLQHLSRDSVDCTYYGMLCDDTKIILASCCNQIISSRYDLTWTTKGSLAFVRNFVRFSNDWMQLLILSMSLLDLRLHGDSAFLGLGRNGRVFRVQNNDDGIMALKIVLTPDDGLVHSVFAEHHTLCCLRNKNLPVVSVLGDKASAVVQEGRDADRCFGVCYLMQEVGTPVEVHNAGQLRCVFMLLLALHRQNEFHGDPRLSNIVCYEGRLLWIDFFKAHVVREGDFLKRSFANDIKILSSSVSNKFIPSPDESSLYDEYVTTYVDNPSEEHLSKILSLFVEFSP